MPAILVAAMVTHLTLVSSKQFPATDWFTSETIVEIHRQHGATRVTALSPCGGPPKPFIISGRGTTMLYVGSHFIYLGKVATLVSNTEYKRLSAGECSDRSDGSLD